MSVTRASVLPLLAPLEPERGDGPVIDEFCGDLAVVYTFGPQYGTRLVTHQDLRQLDLSRRVLRRTALEQLESMSGRAQFHGQPPALMLSFDGLESSLLFADEVWGRLARSVPGDLVVGVPCRDVVIVTGSESEPGLERARRCVDRMFLAGDEHPLTRKLLVRRGGGWEPFERGGARQPGRPGPHPGVDQQPRQYQGHTSWPGERVPTMPARTTGERVRPVAAAGPLPVPMSGLPAASMPPAAAVPPAPLAPIAQQPVMPPTPPMPAPMSAVPAPMSGLPASPYRAPMPAASTQAGDGYEETSSWQTRAPGTGRRRRAEEAGRDSSGGVTPVDGPRPVAVPAQRGYEPATARGYEPTTGRGYEPATARGYEAAATGGRWADPVPSAARPPVSPGWAAGAAAAQAGAAQARAELGGRPEPTGRTDLSAGRVELTGRPEMTGRPEFIGRTESGPRPEVVGRSEVSRAAEQNRAETSRAALSARPVEPVPPRESYPTTGSFSPLKPAYGEPARAAHPVSAPTRGPSVIPHYLAPQYPTGGYPAMPFSAPPAPSATSYPPPTATFAPPPSTYGPSPSARTAQPYGVAHAPQYGDSYRADDRPARERPAPERPVLERVVPERSVMERAVPERMPAALDRPTGEWMANRPPVEQRPPAEPPARPTWDTTRTGARARFSR